VFVAACCAVAVVFSVLARRVSLPANAFGPRGFQALMAFALGTTGALVASRRPQNPIGWILCGGGVLGAIQAVGAAYGFWALAVEGGRPAGALWGAWLDEWAWIPIVGSLGFIAAIFPDGRFLSARWRRVVLAGAAGTAAATVLSALVPDLTIYTTAPNPIGVDVEWLPDVAGASVMLMMFLVVAGTAGAFARFRRSSGDEREQLKWLASSVALVALSLSVYAAIAGASGWAVNPEGTDWSENLVVGAILAVPVSIGIGVLKYRLYDIDVVINKAVVYGALAVFITAVYVAIVVGVGAAFGSGGDPVWSAAAAAVVALAFQPARRRARHLANVLVYGNRATPYEVLSELSTRFAATYSLEDALPRLARVTAEAVGAERARVWLRGDGELRRAASWPPEPPGDTRPVADDAALAFGARETGFPVRHQGELLGAISVVAKASEPLGPAQDKLLGDVAAQAALVLRNVALLEDLRASRQRLVTAQDEERRRIERNIHDGAQQQLVALTVQLRLLEQQVERDPGAAARTARGLQGAAATALEDLRDLARGIYPPLLADEGLAAALTSQARKSATPVTVEDGGLGRYAPEVEAAVYFCALEALQNVDKYAGASAVTIRLEVSDGHLGFSVRDDGVGFDPAAARGSGLTNMRDRLEALGGRLRIETAPGRGTTVIGSVPLSPR
jgi:signal transduction histidine kinase